MPDEIANADRLFIQRATRWGIIAAVGLAVLYGLLWVLSSVLTPLAVAFVIAYLFDPVLDRLQAWRIPRPLGILVILGVGVAVLLGFALFVVPRLQSELGQLSSDLPGYVDATLAWLGPKSSAWFGTELPTTLRDGLNRLQDAGIAPRLETLRSWIGGALMAVGGTVGSLVGLLVIPVIAFYLLVDFDHIVQRIADVVPRPYFAAVSERVRTIDRLMSGFIRGQLTVCSILGVLYAVGFSVIGVHMAVLIGIVAGLLALIPYVGGAVALTSASLVCLFQFGFDGHLLAVVGWYAAVQGLEGFVLTPRIVGESLGLHPVTVIVALMIGGNLLGFLGLLIAVPVSAVIQVFAAELIATYRLSSFYTGVEA